MALYGSIPMKSRRWTPGVKISNIDSPAEELIVDPGLVPQGSDPRYPNSDFIVIPRGRAIAIRPDTSSYEGRAVVTIADGVDPGNKPAGYSGGNRAVGVTESNIFRKWQEHDQWTPTIERHAYIEVPFVPAVNNAYGTLSSGDRLTPYFGSVASINPAVQDKGKLVKFVEQKLYCNHTANVSGAPILTAAIYPAFPPRIVAILTNGTVSTATATLTFNGSNWVATLSSGTCSDILYTMGQHASQIVGEVVHIEPLSATHQYEGWLQWVTDDFRVWDYPPQQMRVPVTAVTNEAATYISANYFRLAHKPVAPYLTITVTLAPTGSDTVTVTDSAGVVTTVTSGAAFVLPIADIPYQDYTLGTYYNINPVTGELFMSPNVVFSNAMPSSGSTLYSLQVTYSYETGFRDGRLYAAGQIGLTDGLGGTGYPGTPANLDIVGGAGSIRAIIY